MEAAVAEKEARMTEWNEGRLDDLSDRVDRIETKMDAGFARVDSRLDELNNTLIRGMWSFGIGMLAFAGALLGIFATKL
jgi:hypothetical protein